MIRVQPMIRKIQRASTGASPHPPFGAFFLVGLIASLVRILSAIVSPGAVYFSDSWDYFVRALTHQVPSPMHSPMISKIWLVGTLGHLTEANVLFLQGIMGVLSALLLYFLLRKILTDLPAAVVSLVITSLPIILFTERTLMTETTVQLTILIGLCTTYLLCTKKGWPQIGALVTTAFAWGLLASLRPSFDLTSLVLMLGVALLFVFLQPGHSTWMKFKQAYLSLLLALVVALVPVGLITYKYHRDLHVASPSPASGLVLASRFAPLLSCNVPAGDLPEVRDAIHELCHLHLAGAPGVTVQTLWTGGALSRVLYNSPELSVASAQLQAAATSALLNHPLAAVKMVSDSLIYQLRAPPLNALSEYWTGQGWQSPPARAAFGNRAAWFGSDTGIQSSTLPFHLFVSGTLRIPQLMADSALLLGLVALGTRYRARRGPKRSPVPLSLRVLGWFSAVIVAGGMVSVAIGSEPGFRYWTILIPSLTVLLCLGLPRRWKRAVPEDGPTLIPGLIGLYEDSRQRFFSLERRWQTYIDAKPSGRRPAIRRYQIFTASTLVVLIAEALKVYVTNFHTFRFDTWNTSDWLINYQGGFVRRGLIGELLYQLSHNLHLCSLTAAVYFVQISAYILCTVGLVVLIFHKKSVWLPWILLSPVGFVFVLYERIMHYPKHLDNGQIVFWKLVGGERKEILLFLALVLLGTASVTRIARWRWVQIVLGLAVYFVFLFSWEGGVLFLPILLVLLGHSAQLKTKESLLRLQWTVGALAVAGALIQIGFHGNLAASQAICSSVQNGHLPARACLGAINNLSVGARVELSTVVHNFPYYSWYLLSATLALLPFVLSGWLRRNWNFFLTMTVCMIPLYLVGTDYGRWIHIWIMCMSFHWLLVDSSERDLQLPRSKPALWFIGLFLWITAWSIPFTYMPFRVGGLLEILAKLVTGG